MDSGALSLQHGQLHNYGYYSLDDDRILNGLGIKGEEVAALQVGSYAKFMAFSNKLDMGQNMYCRNWGFYDVGSIQCSSLTISGTKNRVVSTDNYGNRLLSAYETPTPMFGDLGTATTDDNGYVRIWLDPIFLQTVSSDDYYIFVQSYNGEVLKIKEKTKQYFEILGSPNTKFDFEIKAYQRGFENIRFENQNIIDITTKKRSENDYGEAGSYIYNDALIDYGQQAQCYLEEINL